MNRKCLTKSERQQVYEKYNGHCAYCGKELDIKDMQVDHMIPLRLGGADDMTNYMPSCRLCNHYKRGNSLDGFRTMIEEIPKNWKGTVIFTGLDATTEWLSRIVNRLYFGLK